MVWLTKPPLGTQLDWTHPLNTGLAGFWLFNEGTGNIVNDISGNNNNGTLIGIASTITSGWNPGRLGPAVAFDGNLDRGIVSNAYSNLFPNNIATIMAISLWFKSSGSQNTKGILSFGSFLSDTNPVLLIQQNLTSLRVYTSAAGMIYTSGDIGTNWHHLVYSNNGTNDTVFLDGVQVYNGAQGIITTGKLGYLYFAIGYDGYFIGLIDEVRVWSRPLLIGDVTTLYTSPYEMFLEEGACPELVCNINVL